MSRLVRDAKVVDLSPSLRGVHVQRGPLLLERGGRAFVLDEREKGQLAKLLEEKFEVPEGGAA
jgi:hypothetical protein